MPRTIKKAIGLVFAFVQTDEGKHLAFMREFRPTS